MVITNIPMINMILKVLIASYGLHKNTKTVYDPKGFDTDGYNEYGVDRNGLDKDG